MKIIAIESSGLVASVALVQDGMLTAEYTVNHKITHSQTILPMLNEIKNITELELDSVDAIAVSNGPGSFTGLRIGVALAKGLGLALNKPLVPVSTLEALAYNMYGSSENIVPIMDARRQEVYTGIYCFERKGEPEFSYEIKNIVKECAISISQLISIINESGKPCVFVGDGIEPSKDLIKEKLKVPYHFAPAGFNRQKASSVAVLGALSFEKGNYVSADKCSPEYLRVSQAERERAERMAAENG